jgi:hypothetical protein
MITIRVNGSEPYRRVKVSSKLAEKMESAGLFTNYNSYWGYIEGEYKNTNFEFDNVKYKIEYFSGCFYPFLLQLY